MIENDVLELLKGLNEKPQKKQEPIAVQSAVSFLNVAVFKEKEKPVLVSASCGAGSKLKVATSMNSYESIGSDCVAMCVNDILCTGAEPFFFTGYIDCTKNKKDVTGQIFSGMEKAGQIAGVEFDGGKIRERKDVYGAEELGIVGFAVGVADEAELIDGSTIKPGNAIIGIASSGLHASGYAATSPVFRNFNEGILSTYFDNIGATLGEVMLEPAKIYKKALQSIREEGIRLRGIAHVTEGGLKANLGKLLPEGTSAEISRSSFAHPEIFRMIEESGGFSKEAMYDTFNMGIGMAVVVATQDKETALQAIRHSGEVAFLIGSIKEGAQEVYFVD